MVMKLLAVLDDDCAIGDITDPTFIIDCALNFKVDGIVVISLTFRLLRQLRHAKNLVLTLQVRIQRKFL